MQASTYVLRVRCLIALIIYLLLVFVGAALLAPWAYWGVHGLADAFPKLFQGIANQPFHRYVNRCMIGLAVVGLVPFLRAVGARSWNAVGVVSLRGQFGNLLIGFALGFASLAIVAVLAIAMGARHLNDGLPTGRLLSLAGQAGLSAVVVAALEELLFRGVLFGRLRPVLGDFGAIVLSSGIYSITHFFQRPSPPLFIRWHTGLDILGEMLRGFLDWHSLIPGFLTLALAGGILAWLYRSTGALYASFGLHAGWIFWMKLFAGITQERPQALTWVWGTSKLVDGWTAFIVMVLCGIAVLKWGPKKGKVSRE